MGQACIHDPIAAIHHGNDARVLVGDIVYCCFARGLDDLRGQGIILIKFQLHGPLSKPHAIRPTKSHITASKSYFSAINIRSKGNHVFRMKQRRLRLTGGDTGAPRIIHRTDEFDKPTGLLNQGVARLSI